jgi:hypothetical protein
MQLKVRHVYDFDEDRRAIGPNLSSPSDWDAARELSGPFELPRDRRLWEDRAERSDLKVRARDIVSIARVLGAHTICSYGVGTGALELNIHRAGPDLALTCGDYAPRTVQRLAELFTEALVAHHNFAADPPLEGDLHLMHRLDTELDDSDWRAVFVRFHQPILFVPGLVLGFTTAARELARRVLRPRASRAGWYRNEDALRSLWDYTHHDHELRIGDARAFLLRPR